MKCDCGGILRVTYCHLRDDGLYSRKRVCDKCKKTITTFEVERENYIKDKRLVDGLRLLLKEYMNKTSQT